MTYRYCFDCELMPKDRCVHTQVLQPATPTTPACPLFRPKVATLVAPAPAVPIAPPPSGGQIIACPTCGMAHVVVDGAYYCAAQGRSVTYA